MRFKQDPRHRPLFDPYSGVFSDIGYRRIRSGWYEVFRESILAQLPVDVLESKFKESMGRPTKELYSMAGLVFLKEFLDWTEEKAVDAYMFHSEIQYALNLKPERQSLSVRTLQRYERIFRQHDLAVRVMNEVTARLIDLLEVNITRQRLDSTHFESDMATFGRTRLMGVTIKRFFTQVKRHDREKYDALPKELRERYAPSTQKMFADVAKTKRSFLRQQVAEDLHGLIERFADDEGLHGRQTYKALLRVFEDQCEVCEERITVKKKTGGNVIQNPSDPGATYDGKKGPGYQVQISETCSEENVQQLITSAVVQTAVVSDQESVAPVLDDLEGKDLLPEMLEADGGYNSDENVQLAEAKGVDLQSPVRGSDCAGGGATPGEDPHSLNVDDFVIDSQREVVERCPAGHEPVSSVPDAKSGETLTTMPEEACAGCEFGAECPIKRTKNEFRLKHTAKQRRLAARRREQATDAFKEHHHRRAGLEGTNGGLKRRLGLGRLRVRGFPAVRHAIYLRIAGWNIFRAAAILLEKTKSEKKTETAKAKDQANSSLSRVLSARVSRRCAPISTPIDIVINWIASSDIVAQAA